MDLHRFCDENENLPIFDRSFRIHVETYNRHFTQHEKVDKIETFPYLPVRGAVNLRSPEVVWWYIEFYGLDPNDVPAQPVTIIFGRWLSDGRRAVIHEISLKTRKFIGNTSMDAQLSLLMANQALVKPGHLVYDPFVGTGSLLVAAAKFGAFVVGGDIDYLMLHARTRPSRISQKIREKDESIRANLRQYNCDRLYVDVLVSDFSKSVWRDNVRFDSIITDRKFFVRSLVAACCHEAFCPFFFSSTVWHSRGYRTGRTEGTCKSEYPNGSRSTLSVYVTVQFVEFVCRSVEFCRPTFGEWRPISLLDACAQVRRRMYQIPFDNNFFFFLLTQLEMITTKIWYRNIHALS